MKKNKYIFVILFFLNLFNYIDRQALYAVFPLLQRDLHLADWQLGTLASAFMVVYMCYAPLIGYLADRSARQKWIQASAFVWSTATLLCAGAKNFAMLLCARGLTGVGEGGFTTVAQPFLAEHYPKAKHARVLASFGLALPLGSALGYALGGAIGQHWGWKAAFMCVAIPGFVLALLSGHLKDEAHHTREKEPRWKEYRALLQNKPFLYICLTQAMITFLMGGCAAWIPTYLVRYLHINTAQAGTLFGGLLIVGGAAGTWLGGKLAEYLFAKTPRGYYLTMAFALIGCLPFMGAGLWAQSLGGMLVCFSAVIVLLFLPTGAISAALIDTTAPTVRSMAFAVNIFIIHLLGDALSPTLIGTLSSFYQLRNALLIAGLVTIPGLYFCYLAQKYHPLQKH